MGVREVVIFFSFTALAGWAMVSARADPLAPVEAASHLGEVATVCGCCIDKVCPAFDWRADLPRLRERLPECRIYGGDPWQ